MTAPLLLPPRAAVEGSRRRLLEEALTQFAQRGYHGVSVRNIAVASDLSPAALYVHHPSKEALLMELMVIGHEEHRDRLRAAFEQAPDDPPQQIRALVEAHVRMHGEFRLLARVCNNEIHALSDENRQAVQEIRGVAERFFTETIERGVRAGAFAVKNPWLAVAAIGAMGIRVAEWWNPETPIGLDEVAATYGEFALQILGAGL